jgi:uncharacterized membrane protein YkoI
LLGLAACVWLAPASAQVPPQDFAVQPRISEDDAVAMVRERTGGKVLRVERRGEDSEVTYLIRVLTPDGRLREYRVDARTGRMR